eukprot:PhF_6_TR14183/c0_g1_i1/m.22709/K08819/CDK12_13; cyclin-dependent kinase 12/13
MDVTGEEYKGNEASLLIGMNDVLHRCEKRLRESGIDVPPATLSRITDRYTLQKKIGEGAFGCVSVATDNITNHPVVVKEIRGPMFHEAYGIQHQLVRECQLLEHIRHENIVQLIEVIVEPTERIYLIFAYCDHDLGGLIRFISVLPISAIKSLFKQLLCGLDYLHQKSIVHRDVKPANLLIDAYGTLKICDFGWARVVQNTKTAKKSPSDPSRVERAELTYPPATLYYRPPELLLVENPAKVKPMPPYGSEVDIWGAGCCLYDMIAGKPLFPGNTEVEALHAIYQVLGRPPEVEMYNHNKFPSFVSAFGNYNYQRTLEKKLEDLGPRMSKTCAQLLKSIFDFDPLKRPTAGQLLGHAWFDEAPFACPRREIPLPQEPQHRFVQRIQQQIQKQQSKHEKLGLH